MICNFVDDNTLYVCDTSLESVLQKLLSDVPVVIDWFHSNELVVNPEKFQVTFLGFDGQRFPVTIDDNLITSSTSVKLLGVNIDCKLSFNDHIFEF